MKVTGSNLCGFNRDVKLLQCIRNLAMALKLFELWLLFLIAALTFKPGCQSLTNK